MIYVISDIHWNINELEKLIQLLNINKEDTLIFLWDYIDKWLETEKTLRYLLYLDTNYSVIFLKGNHEYVWEQYLIFWDTTRQDFLLKYWWIESLKLYELWVELLYNNDIGRLKIILGNYIHIIEKTIDFYVVNNYLLIHAWLLENQLEDKNISLTERNFFLRLSDINLNKKYLNKYTIVAGHNAHKSPIISNWYIWIDLWSAYNWAIWCLCIEENKIISSQWEIFYI